MDKFLLKRRSGFSDIGRSVGGGFRNLIGYFLVLAIVSFSLFGNRSKIIVEEHQGACHKDALAQEIYQENAQHRSHHHNEQPQDSSEKPLHHHHVEVSSVLVIAVVTPGDLSIFQTIVSLTQLPADEACPPSLSSEIVKPPQVA